MRKSALWVATNAPGLDGATRVLGNSLSAQSTAFVAMRDFYDNKNINTTPTTTRR
jgi:hypothetical protein